MVDRIDTAKQSDDQSSLRVMTSQRMTDTKLVRSHPADSHSAKRNQIEPSRVERLGLSTKAKIMAIAISVLPVIGVGATLYSVAEHSLDQQASQSSQSHSDHDTKAQTEQLKDAQTQLTLILLLGVGSTAVLAFLLANYLTKRTLVPLLAVTDAIKKLGEGELNTRVTVAGEAEIADLGTHVNWMAENVQSKVENQVAQINRTKQFSQIIASARTFYDSKYLFDQAVNEAQELLKTDRVFFYRFNLDGSGVVVSETVAPGWPSCMDVKVEDTYFMEADGLEQYRQGRVLVLKDIYQDKINPCHRELLEQLRIRAEVITPIRQNNQLIGLLCAQQCAQARDWTQTEVDTLQQLSDQVGASLSDAGILAQKEAELRKAQLFSDIATAAAQDKGINYVFDIAVGAAKQDLKADRVVLYCFDPDWSGTIVAEAVEPGWPTALADKIADPFIPAQLEEYKKGQVVSTNNVSTAGFSTSYLQFLDRLKVKSNLVVPIVSNNELLGLLIAHHCSRVRAWQPTEVAFMTQLSSQVGLALTNVSLLAEKVAEAERFRLLKDTIVRLRRSLNFNDILSTSVEEVRTLLNTDRVVIYRFNDDWVSGTITAESVAPGWIKAYGQTIDDPLAPGDIERYSSGRVWTTDNIQTANLTDCHCAILKRLQVKANIVAPILRNGQLIGLLCGHQCSGPRTWQPAEIDLFTQLATQIGFALDQAYLLEQQVTLAERAKALNEITSRIRDSLETTQVFNTALTGTREALAVDRTVVYMFDDKWQGTIVAESVGQGWPQALGANIADPCFAEQYVEKYRRGRVKATDDIYKAGLTPCYLGQLEPFKVKANLVAPILADRKLHGLLVAHQCSGPRHWQEADIDFFKQIAIQVGYALDQVSFFSQKQQALQVAEDLSQEQSEQKEALQRQLVELLDDIEGAARGDLTVRAEVTTGEIGTVADFFNSIIESLRAIVTQVKASAIQVNASLGQNEGAIRQLADEALKQAGETTRTLDSVEQMTRSIQAVADSARQAAEVTQTAHATAQKSGAAMDLTVQSIVSLRETVGETAKKVKRLGESSQQISKVVSLINQIALQTNLLAINAGIEAARAGEEGQGFAVIAEEVGELAARSAAATQEIEQIVDNIQVGTSEVVKAMELGTAQVVEGTHLVGDAKQSLGQILEVSRQVNQLVQSISDATVSQVQTSQAVTSLMKEIALVSERTTLSSRQVSTSLRQTVEVAQQLQASVGTFKVDAD